MAGSDSLSSSSPKEVMRNWAEIPPEIMSLILTKVGAMDILIGAQFVCPEWRKLCKDPHLFHSIHIDHHSPKTVNIFKEAVNRSCGQLVDFSIAYAQHYSSQHIIAKDCPLRRLRFQFCYSSSLDSTLVDMAKKLPLLEELEICYCCCFYHPKKVTETFGRHCPLLKSFKLNYPSNQYLLNRPTEGCDKEALAIAQTMPELRHLNLRGAYLTNKGLQAILKGCPHLNFLDLSLCPHLNYAAECLTMLCVDRNIELRISG